MNATTTRRIIQVGEHREWSEDTRECLKIALQRTRMELGGLSLFEVAEVIREAYTQSEIDGMTKNL